MFDDKTRKKILNGGGRIETPGGKPPVEQLDETLNLVKRISNREAQGFFIVMERKEFDEDGRKGIESSGVVKLAKTSKTEALEIIVRSLGLTMLDLKKFVLLKELEDKED